MTTPRDTAVPDPLPRVPESPLVDFPLRAEQDLFRDAPPPVAALGERESVAVAAPLGPRALAFAADGAASLLAASAGLLAAAVATGRAIRPAGLWWAAAFAVQFSFFLVVLSLTLFGKTVGMALLGLAARPGDTGRHLHPHEAARRWLGTALAAVPLGLPLLFTRRDRTAPTPADRLSGRSLVREDAPAEA